MRSPILSLPEGLYIIRARFDINRLFRIFALTFAASVLVTAIAGYYGDAPDAAAILFRSLAIAAVVAAGAAWTGQARPAGDAGRTGDAGTGPQMAGGEPREPAANDHVGNSLEEQGITAKLLELIALGDRYGNAFSLALINVDHLDDIEHQYGDEAADQLLKRVVSALAHTLRMPDRLGRFERGTYLVVLPETALPGAIQIAERLRTAVTELDVTVSPRVRIHTTASVGVTSFRRGDDMRGLLERAERTLHGAQEQGRNRVLPDMAA